VQRQKTKNTTIGRLEKTNNHLKPGCVILTETVYEKNNFFFQLKN
jgi:hypothetical protein